MKLVEILVYVLNERKGRLRETLHGRIGKFREAMIGKNLITRELEQSNFDKIIVQFQSHLYKNCTNEQSIETLCCQFIRVLKEFGKKSSDAAIALEESWRDSVAKEIPKMKSFLSSATAADPSPLAGERPGLQHHHDDGQYGNSNPDYHLFVKLNGDGSVSGTTSVTNNPSSDVFLTEGVITSESLPPETERPVPNTGYNRSLLPASSSPDRIPIEETLQNGPIMMKPFMSPSQRHQSFLDGRSVSEPHPHHTSYDGRERDRANRSVSLEEENQWSDVNSPRRRGKSRKDSKRNDTRRNSKRNDSRRKFKRNDSRHNSDSQYEQKDLSHYPQQQQQKLVTRVETLERDLHQAEVKNLQQQNQSLRQQTESQSSKITTLTQQLDQQKKSNVNAATNNYNGHDKTKKRYNNRKGSSQPNISQPLLQSNTSQPSDSNKSRIWTIILLVVLIAIVLYIAVRLSI